MPVLIICTALLRPNTTSSSPYRRFDRTPCHEARCASQSPGLPRAWLPPPTTSPTARNVQNLHAQFIRYRLRLSHGTPERALRAHLDNLYPTAPSRPPHRHPTQAPARGQARSDPSAPTPHSSPR
ncbi:hypothetical protein C2E23DRAFT_445616 [Lenzites betulinus]|nr:hypothetical protein C2E23DRAFT_445616 [Lenzites betulinus]